MQWYSVMHVIHATHTVFVVYVVRCLALIYHNALSPSRTLFHLFHFKDGP